MYHSVVTTDHQPIVLPTAYDLIGDILYLHGSTGNRILRMVTDQSGRATITAATGSCWHDRYMSTQ
ncbi:pyridoxamine 5'-phosphate oxidase family protein [Actinopolyspora xinjiangensis]|uniref:pyridoxamine 5'-phosphate oxidase family protein n=1 Tax=Actinopolyspora xinjiangensis TaxID=405564 RepID=UPI00147C8EC7